MEEFEFDRTRKAIGVDKLDEEEKKRLFQRFREKGGKVLKEKAVSKEPTFAKKQQTQSPSQTTKLPSDFYKEQRKKESERIAREKIKKETILKKASSPMAIFSLRLQLWLKGIAFFKKEFLKPSFVSFLNLEFKRSILECNILATELLSDSTFIEIFKKQFKIPLYLELLKRVYLLYDRKQLSELTSSLSDPEVGVVIDTIQLPVFHFLRQLYVLQPFRELTLRMLLNSIEIQKNIQKKPADIYKNKKKRIQDSWHILMDKAYPKLVLLAQFMEKKKLEPFTELFEEMIGIKEKDKIDPNSLQDFKDVQIEEVLKNFLVEKPAKSKQESPTREPQEQPEPENSEEEAKRKVHEKIYQYGLRFVNLYPLEDLRKRYDSKDEFKEITLYDKIFISFLFLNFFDEQFGFIFSTNKLKLNSFFRDGVRIQLKDEMSLLYETFRRVYEVFRRYYDDYREYKKVLEDEFADKNSLDYRKKLDYYEGRRVKSAKETHAIMYEYIKKCEQILLTLFRDVRDQNRIVANPDDVIQLDFDSNRTKLMNNKKVKEVIRDAYATAYCISFRMKEELYPSTLEITEEEFQLHFSKIV